MTSPHNNFDLDRICRHLDKDRFGIWHSRNSEKCHYPEDGAERLAGIEEESFWFTHRKNCIIELVRRFPPGGFIVDVGGGTGFVTMGLMQAGFDTLLLEPRAGAVMYAHQRGVAHILCATIDQTTFDPHSIPAVGVFDVLEHIKDDAAFLVTLKELLMPTGKLYLTVPAFQCLWSHEDGYAEHFRRYRLGMLCSRLQQCGFEIDYATYFFSYLAIPLFFVKVIPTKLRLAKPYTHEQTRQEHVIQSGWRKRILDQIHAWEQGRIKKGKQIFLGTSILIAAHTKSHFEKHL